MLANRCSANVWRAIFLTANFVILALLIIWVISLVQAHAAYLRIPKLHPVTYDSGARYDVPPAKITPEQTYAPNYWRCMLIHHQDLKLCKGLH